MHWDGNRLPELKEFLCLSKDAMRGVHEGSSNDEEGAAIAEPQHAVVMPF